MEKGSLQVEHKPYFEVTLAVGGEAMEEKYHWFCPPEMTFGPF